MQVVSHAVLSTCIIRISQQQQQIQSLSCLSAMPMPNSIEDKTNNETKRHVNNISYVSRLFCSQCTNASDLLNPTQRTQANICIALFWTILNVQTTLQHNAKLIYPKKKKKKKSNGQSIHSKYSHKVLNDEKNVVFNKYIFTRKSSIKYFFF